MPVRFTWPGSGRASAVPTPHCGCYSGASRGDWPRTPHPDPWIFRRLYRLGNRPTTQMLRRRSETASPPVSL